MKFARDFRETLASQVFPDHWVRHAIPYGQLKKCLKKIQEELSDLGLDTETLRFLIDPANTSSVALKYHLNVSDDSNIVRPTLTVHVHFRDDEVVDASLTPASRSFVERIALELSLDRSQDHGEPEDHVAADSELVCLEDTPLPPLDAADILSRDLTVTSLPDHSGNHYKTIEVPLVFDGQFFHILQSDVENIDVLQDRERKDMSTEIKDLGDGICRLTRPTRFSKSDLTRWRHIFELYLDAQVFFATYEQDHGTRSSQDALRQLQWFQAEVEKRNLVKTFKIRESLLIYERFVHLNATILKNLQFEELNRLAVLKILKKFDKRTSFGISKSFRKAIQSHGLMAGDVGKDVCAQLSQELTSVVPQLNNYLCPICFAVAYRPVRLACEHVFCIRCMVKIQRRLEKQCPLCRAEVVMKATADNLDTELAKYMKKYFPKEVREKQRQNELERGIEDYGPGYQVKQCIIM